MSNSRELVTVIDQVLAVIPEDNIDARAELVKVQQSSRYAAPEMQGQWWTVAQNALIEFVGADKPYSQDVITIWNG